MEYPFIKSKPKARQMIETFLGYNHNLRIGDGEFYDMENMSSDHFPTLSPRKARAVYKSAEDKLDGAYSALLGHYEGLCYVDGEYLIVRDDIKINLKLTQGEKHLVKFGSYIIVMPDKKWVNLSGKYLTYGDIEVFTEITSEVNFTLCNLAGNPYKADPSDTEPESPEDGKLWIDTSDKPNVLKKYSDREKKWISIPTTYVRMEAQGIGMYLSEGDGVEISGIVTEGLTGLNGSHVIWGVDDRGDYIILQGMILNTGTQDGQITISRKMPDMDFIFESNNRMWGCKYGSNAKGQIVNEIYASKLGDFTNWSCYMGVSTDSYGVSVGTDGKFTGGISYGGNPIFFKENCMHKIYGDYPANFQVQTIPCIGVVYGAEDSLAIVDNVLFYKSRNGVCAYDGSLPAEMSEVFGDIKYYGANAVAFEHKYYISMQSNNGWELFVYDTQKKMWHREGYFFAKSFAEQGGYLLAIDGDTGHIIDMKTDQPANETVDWYVETGLIGMTMPDMKYITKLLVRLSLAKGAQVSFSIQYDSIGDWKELCSFSATTLRSYSVPIIPRRCDHFRLGISGTGDCKIYSIVKTIEQGSDVS